MYARHKHCAQAFAIGVYFYRTSFLFLTEALIHIGSRLTFLFRGMVLQGLDRLPPMTRCYQKYYGDHAGQK